MGIVKIWRRWETCSMSGTGGQRGGSWWWRIGQRRGARRGRIRTIGVVVVVVCPPPGGGIMRLHLVMTEAWIAPLAA
jgi:hypothetical protein